MQLSRKAILGISAATALIEFLFIMLFVVWSDGEIALALLLSVPMTIIMFGVIFLLLMAVLGPARDARG